MDLTMPEDFPGLALLVAALMAISGESHASPPPARDASLEETNRALVVDFYDRFFNKHDIASARVVADSYRQAQSRRPGRQGAIRLVLQRLLQGAPEVDLAHRAQRHVRGPGLSARPLQGRSA